MKSRALTLRLAVLLEEYSVFEVRQTLDLLSDNEKRLEAIESLLVKSRPKKDVNKRKKKITSPPKDSSALASLRLSDPEKYNLAVEFNQLLRSGRILKSFDELKRFGASLSKEFEPRKSRKESITPLVLALVARPRAEIADLIRESASSMSGDADEYQRLARFLIEGKN